MAPRADGITNLSKVQSTGFLTTFGADEPMGCYEDIDHADCFITWGNNMAEMHPVLFSRMLEQKSKRGAKIIDFATRTSRSSTASDRSILFEPQTDLAVANKQRLGE